MSALRFVQFSDVHLDSSLTGALGLPPEKQAVLRQDIAASFARACALAREVRADLVLIPGDLFDYETVSAETVALVKDVFRNLAPIRVFIAPGNHDNLWPGSPYADSDGWPENVHIFRSATFETVALPDLDCSITGVGHAHRGVTDRVLTHPIDCERLRNCLLVFHGSRDAYLPSGKETVIPFSDAELIGQGFTYSAIGHYHSPLMIRDDGGAVKGAYSGCVQGRDTGEAGEKCVYIGEITPDGGVTLEAREVAERRVHGIDLDVTGLSNDAALATRLATLLTASGARTQDIVNLRLMGSASAGLQLDPAAIERCCTFFHTCLDTSRIVPDYDLDALAQDSAAPTLKSAFVRRMLELAGSAEDDRRRKVIQDATYYGLYALDGRRLEPRDVD